MLLYGFDDTKFNCMYDLVSLKYSLRHWMKIIQSSLRCVGFLLVWKQCEREMRKDRDVCEASSAKYDLAV